MIKLCAWCGEEMVRTGRMSDAAWTTKRLHARCVTSFRHHRCAKKDVVHPPERECPACGKVLVRREDEKWQAWSKRECCDKSCAAKNKFRSRAAVAVVAQDVQDRSGVKQYLPGTEEFNRIAALYA